MKSFIVAAALITIAACAGQTRDALRPDPELDSSALRIRVENQNFSNAVIYAVDGGRRVRLGTVTGKDTKSFTFRWGLDRLQMRIHFTGGRSFDSDRLTVDPGIDDNLLLTIGSSRRPRLWIGRRGRSP